MKKELIKLSGVLCLITLIASLLLACVNEITFPKIAMAEEKATVEAMQNILSEAKSFEKITDSIYEGKAGDKTVGYCVNVAPSGFGGEIKMIVGIGTDEKIKGIEILSHSETAGLGAKAADESFKERFKEKNLKLSVVKTAPKNDGEVQAITGATVTSRAVVKGIDEAVEMLDKLKGGEK